MTDEERLKIVETALAAEFPKIWEWAPTEILEPYGPDDLGRVQNFGKAVARMRQECRAVLRDLPDDELRKMQTFRRNSTHTTTWPWAEVLPKCPNDYLRRIPADIAYGFGHPSFDPDFTYWAMMPQLSIVEATLLSVGADPRYMSSDALYALKSRRPERLWSAQSFLIDRYNLLFRVFPSGPDRKMHMSTKSFHGWLMETGLEIHPGFKKALGRRFDERPQPIVVQEATDVEKRSLLRLIAGMAIKGYRYDPRNQRNEAVQEIADDLDRLGISLDLKTIRKWLQESCKLIDQENLDK